MLVDAGFVDVSNLDGGMMSVRATGSEEGGIMSWREI